MNVFNSNFFFLRAAPKVPDLNSNFIAMKKTTFTYQELFFFFFLNREMSKKIFSNSFLDIFSFT